MAVMAACHWLSLTCLSLSLQIGQTMELFGTVEVKGYVPQAREYPSMVLYQKRLWTFGGFFNASGHGEFFGDLNCFDIDSKTWTKVAADGYKPLGRLGHGAVVDFAGTMWLWGGKLEDSLDRAVFSLNLNEIDLSNSKSSGAWQRVNTPWDTTLPFRWTHSTVMNGTGMVIFGGMDPKMPKLFADVQYFDFQEKMWSEIKCQGDVPSARAGHGAAMTSLGEMWVYGGEGPGRKPLEDLYVLKLETKTWVKMGAKAVSPGPLVGHFQVMDAAARMWLAGGASGEETGQGANHDKVFYIDTTMSENAEWKEVVEFRGAVQRTAAAAAIETSGRMWCYGGTFGKGGDVRDFLANIVWLDTNQPTPSTATTSTSAHPRDPAATSTSAQPLDPGQSGGVGVGTILVILLVVAAIAAGVLFLRKRRGMRLLQEVQEPRQIELDRA